MTYVCILSLHHFVSSCFDKLWLWNTRPFSVCQQWNLNCSLGRPKHGTTTATCTSRDEYECCISLGLSPRLKCDSLTSWKRTFTHSSPYRPCYDEISLVAYLACSLLKPLTCQNPGMASIVRSHLSDVRSIGNRWAFNCIFVQIAK